MAAPKLMTVDEYLRAPETVLPAELRFGALRVAEAPTPWHQSVVASLFRALDAYVRVRGIGEMWLSPLDVILDDERALIVQPDLIFIAKRNAWIVRDRVRGAPDLVNRSVVAESTHWQDGGARHLVRRRRRPRVLARSRRSPADHGDHVRTSAYRHEGDIRTATLALNVRVPGLHGKLR